MQSHWPRSVLTKSPIFFVSTKHNLLHFVLVYFFFFLYEVLCVLAIVKQLDTHIFFDSECRQLHLTYSGQSRLDQKAQIWLHKTLSQIDYMSVFLFFEVFSQTPLQNLTVNAVTEPRSAFDQKTPFFGSTNDQKHSQCQPVITHTLSLYFV